MLPATTREVTRERARELLPVGSAGPSRFNGQTQSYKRQGSGAPDKGAGVDEVDVHRGIRRVRLGFGWSLGR